jgi:hypothetical protein
MLRVGEANLHAASVQTNWLDVKYLSIWQR